MTTIIIPLVKNKTGNLNDRNNYRPIALVSACSKILELVLLGFIEDAIDTSDSQFGFKSKHGTDMCVYALKNTIAYYKSYNSQCSHASWTPLRNLIESITGNCSLN